MIRPTNWAGRAAADGIWDVVIIGAGPAGAMAARELAVRRIPVLLVDRQSFPRPKVCGACLNLRVVECLERVGLPELLPRSGAIPTRRFRAVAGQSSVEVALPGGVAVSREAFDMALIDAACEAGATFLPESTARLLPASANQAEREIEICRRPTREIIRARVVLAACGLGQPFLTQSGEFTEVVEPHSRIGVGVSWHTETARVEPGTICMAVGSGGYVGLVQVEEGSLNLAAALEPSAVKRAGSPAGAVAAILATTEWSDLKLPDVGAWRGTLPLTRRLLRVAGQRILALGDATGYIEPFTGEGIAWALESGLAVVPLVERALADWTPDIELDWIDLHRKLITQRQFWCHGFAALLRHPACARWGIRLAAAWPGLCRPIVERLNRPAPARETCRT